MRHHFGMFAGLAALLAGPAYTATRSADLHGAVDLQPRHGRRGRGEGIRRGKHKLSRHGQKLKSCRNKISRRVRRKHRRAA